MIIGEIKTMRYFLVVVPKEEVAEDTVALKKDKSKKGKLGKGGKKGKASSMAVVKDPVVPEPIEEGETVEPEVEDGSEGISHTQASTLPTVDVTEVEMTSEGTPFSDFNIINLK